MKFHDLQKEALNHLKLLVNQGKEVCNEFDARMDTTNFCDKCGYSHAMHIYKQILEIEE